MDKTCLACRLFFHTVQNIYMHKTGQQYIQEKETEKQSSLFTLVQKFNVQSFFNTMMISF